MQVNTFILSILLTRSVTMTNSKKNVFYVKSMSRKNVDFNNTI